jgi:hypothetical protein
MATEQQPAEYDKWSSAWKFWAMIFGALFSVPALISVTQRLFKIGLVQIIQDAITTYRKLYYPLFHQAAAYFLAIFPYFDLHQLVYWLFMSREMYQDLSALAFISAIALLRAIVIERARQFEKGRAVIVKENLERELLRLHDELAKLPPIEGDIRRLRIVAAVLGLNTASELLPIPNRAAGEQAARDFLKRDQSERKLRTVQQRLEALARGRGRIWLGGLDWTGLEPLLEGYILLAFAAIACGFTLFGLLLPILTIFALPMEEAAVRRINQQYLISLLLAVGAAVSVYIANELMK